MHVGEWQDRLEAAFGSGGIVGSRLLEVMDCEHQYGEYIVSTYHGQTVLMASFQDFFIETLRTAETWVAQNGWPPQYEYFGAWLVTFLTLFRSFRACESLFLSGYPLDAFALLRDVKDRALLYCGVARNLTTWSALNSMETGERKSAEGRVRDHLLRSESGLPQDVRDQLKVWAEIFHQEVHGSRLTLVQEMGRLRDGAQMSVGPVPQDLALAMYMNRAVEAGWLCTKLLPFLQPCEEAFGQDWTRRHRVLDQSFRYCERALSDLGKPVADAVIALVNAKFSFDTTFCYFDADGSGS